ncbi:MAG: L-threonylcarbamoyladenylate synthase [Halobacteriales archaeon]
MDVELEDAARAVRDGKLVVYPTETVYGLGADALDPASVERVFEAKDRPADQPVSLAVPSVEAALNYVTTEERTRAFMSAFLPGPVTVVAPKTQAVPDGLTADRDRVGVRVPDHPVALALLERVSPLTATSANISGTASVRAPDELSPALRAAVAVVLDGGQTPGGGSTVVDPARAEIHRRCHQAEAVEAWLDDR